MEPHDEKPYRGLRKLTIWWFGLSFFANFLIGKICESSSSNQEIMAVAYVSAFLCLAVACYVAYRW